MGEVQELFLHFVVTFDDNSSVAAANSVIHGEVRRASVALFFKVRRGNIILRAQKNKNYVAANNVPVTVVPHTVSQEHVFLARKTRQWSVALMYLSSPLILD